MRELDRFRTNSGGMPCRGHETWSTGDEFSRVFESFLLVLIFVYSSCAVISDNNQEIFHAILQIPRYASVDNTILVPMFGKDGSGNL